MEIGNATGCSEDRLEPGRDLQKCLFGTIMSRPIFKEMTFVLHGYSAQRYNQVKIKLIQL